VTRAELVAKLRSLLAGERTEAATAEAAELLAELEAGQKRPPTPRPQPVDPDVEERRGWVRLVGRGGMSQRVWSPGPQPGHTKALVRDSFRPWG
jgi:hypothetical protein